MNYYEILKVPKNASEQQIKSSYKELVKQYHPDLYLGDKNFAEHKIKEINEAYDILSHPEKKAEYDDYLKEVFYAPATTISYQPNFNQPADEPTSSEPKWSLTQWFMEKFNGFDKKRQLQIFIAVLILFLSLFLINLIEVNYYLNHSSEPVSNTTSSNTTNSTNTTSAETDSDYEYPEEFKALDDWLYDLFQGFETDTDSFSEHASGSESIF